MEELRCYRPLIIGRRGAVAANHPLAAQAGLLALRAGGNAVDAAVATARRLRSGPPIVQADLARTLEEIASEGAECLYRGALARRLAAACADAGVPVGDSDLAAFEAERQEPIGIDYRGFTVLEAPPN